MLNGLFGIIIAYLLGSIPFGYILTKIFTGTDVRESGSGNIGATNVLRTAGRTLGIATLVLDIAKGVVAVAIAEQLTYGPEDPLFGGGAASSPGWMANAALAVVAGHIFPLFLTDKDGNRFQGGKGVATFAGAFGYLMPLPMLGTVIIFLATVALTRYISAASIVGAAVFPVGAMLLLRPSLTEMLCSLIAAGLVIYRHRGNMERIRAGTEPAFDVDKLTGKIAARLPKMRDRRFK